MPSDPSFWIYVAGYFGWFGYGLWRFRRAPGDEIVQVALALIWPVTVTVHVVYLMACWIEVSDRVRAEASEEADVGWGG